MRTCPFDGCGKEIDPALFACREHWYSLDPAQRVAVWDCYRKWQRGQIDGDELRRRQQDVLDAAQARS